MKDLLLTLLHLAVMTATLCGLGGVRAVIAENLLLKQPLIVLRRPRQRAPRLTASDRLLFGFGSLFLSPGRIRKVAIGVRPSTLLALHQALVRRTYRRLFSSSACPKKPGPKGPSEALIQAIVELTSRNPRFGCPRSARIISRTFGANIDKNVVYRVLSKHYRPIPGGTGPSWVSFIGHTTDSLWSVDLFRGGAIVLRSDWVLVVMDQFTRRLVGVGVHRGPVNGADLCRMFNVAMHGRGAPRHLSTDHDPLFEAHRWTANLRILEIDEIKTVPHVPRSHPFVERLIGTTRREFLDQVLFWNARDLERTLADFQAYYNEVRSHASLKGHTPSTFAGGHMVARVLSSSVGAWQTWSMKRDTPSYHGYRFPPEIISHAVWLYHRFGVSFRDVEDLLAQRGITVSYEAIRLWCLTFGSDTLAGSDVDRAGWATSGTWTRSSSPSRAGDAISGVPSIKMATSSISSSSRVATVGLPHAFFASC